MPRQISFSFSAGHMATTLAVLCAVASGVLAQSPQGPAGPGSENPAAQQGSMDTAGQGSTGGTQGPVSGGGQSPAAGTMFQYSVNPDYYYQGTGNPGTPGSSGLHTGQAVQADWYTTCNETIASICQTNSSAALPATVSVPSASAAAGAKRTAIPGPQSSLPPNLRPTLTSATKDKWLTNEQSSTCLILYYVPTDAQLPTQDNCTFMLEGLASGVGPAQAQQPEVNRASVNINQAAPGGGFPKGNDNGTALVENKIRWIVQPGTSGFQQQAAAPPPAPNGPPPTGLLSGPEPGPTGLLGGQP